MKRFHMHISVDELEKNIRFYSGIFGVEPTVTKDDYARWALDDPAVNFAISTRGKNRGLDHVGIQTETDAELTQLRERIEASGIDGFAQDNTACCYTKSDKYWVQDPQGIAWETFHSLESVPMFGDADNQTSEGACCVPELSQSASNCS